MLSLGMELVLSISAALQSYIRVLPCPQVSWSISEDALDSHAAVNWDAANLWKGIYPQSETVSEVNLGEILHFVYLLLCC